jgi:hypothetical protein
MTPKNILAKFVYGIAAVPAVLGLIFFIPGGLLLIAAFLLGCGADKMETEPYDPEGDTTIEEYEQGMDDDGK